MGITRKAQAFQCIDLGILAANWGYNVLAQVPGSDVKARFDGLISLKKKPAVNEAAVQGLPWDVRKESNGSGKWIC